MSEIREVLISDIKVNPYQPRTYFDENAIVELSNSIQETGLVHPITLREAEDGYELIAGERRLRACMKLGYKKITANIMDKNDNESMYMALIENIQREDLSSIEEAKAYVKIIELNNISQSELARKLGKSQPSIANKIRLLNLDDNIQNAIEAKLISERHARAMLSLDKDKQNEILNKIISEKLSVAQTEALIKNKNKKKIKKNKNKGLSRQIQIGINTIKHAFDMVSKSGINCKYDEKELDDCVEITVKLMK